MHPLSARSYRHHRGSEAAPLVPPRRHPCPGVPLRFPRSVAVPSALALTRSVPLRGTALARTLRACSRTEERQKQRFNRISPAAHRAIRDDDAPGLHQVNPHDRGAGLSTGLDSLGEARGDRGAPHRATLRHSHGLPLSAPSYRGNRRVAVTPAPGFSTPPLAEAPRARRENSTPLSGPSHRGNRGERGRCALGVARGFLARKEREAAQSVARRASRRQTTERGSASAGGTPTPRTRRHATRLNISGMTGVWA